MQRMVKMEKFEVGHSCRWYSLHFSYSSYCFFHYLSYLLKSVLSVDNFQLIICVDTIAQGGGDGRKRLFLPILSTGFAVVWDWSLFSG